MACRIMGISLVVATAFMIFAHNASAQSGCTTAIVSLAPCLGYITGNSSTPSASCCSQLSSVVQTQVQCLCTVLNGGASSFGININQTQALTLPGACKIQTPPISQCQAGVGGPASSPSGSPTTPSTPTTSDTPSSTSPTSPSTPSVPIVPSGTGSKTTPAGNPSIGGSYRSTGSIVFSTIFAVASISSLAIF